MNVTRLRESGLIVIGGAPGSGKTTLARMIAREFQLPLLNSDMLGQMLKKSLKSASEAMDTESAYRVAYDVLFNLCDEFLRLGLVGVVDISLGWPFHWERLDALQALRPTSTFVPIILHCPKSVCAARVASRIGVDASDVDPLALYDSWPTFPIVWSYLEMLSRPDIALIDADRPVDEVYASIRELIQASGLLERASNLNENIDG